MEQAELTRKIRHSLEPVAAAVYFSAEPNQEYLAIGLTPLEGYFCSRSAALRKQPGELVTALYGFFNPEMAIPNVEGGWKKAEPRQLIEARLRGATAALDRMLEGIEYPRITEILRPAIESAPSFGRPLFAAWLNEWRTGGHPDDPSGVLWRTCDLFREHRGDSHLAAWLRTGLAAPECLVLTATWWGANPEAYMTVFGWSPDQVAEARESLVARGLMEGGSVTLAGAELRVEVETATDAAQATIATALEPDADELIELLESAAERVVAGGGFPMPRLRPPS